MTFFRSFSNVALVRHIAVEYKAGRNHEFRPNAVRWELDYKVTTHAKHRKTFQLQHEIFVTTHAKHRKTFQLLHEIFFIKILLIDWLIDWLKILLIDWLIDWIVCCLFVFNSKEKVTSYNTNINRSVTLFLSPFFLFLLCVPIKKKTCTSSNTN